MKPFEWVHLVSRDQALTGRDVAIAGCMAFNASGGKMPHSRLSLTAIQRWTRLSRHTVIAGVRALEKAGWIAEQPMSVPSPKGGRWHTTTVHHLVTPDTLLPVDNYPPEGGEVVQPLHYPGATSAPLSSATTAPLVDKEDLVDHGAARVGPVDNPGSDPAGQAQVMAFIAGIADAKRLR